MLTGRKAPIARPLLNAQVTGSDSVQTAVYRGRLHWFWGDTNWPRYPLGNFNVPGATSKLPADGGLDPALGLDLEYFVDDEGFARATCSMPGDGPTWLDALFTLPVEGDQQAMYGGYYKIRGPLTIYQHGLVRWNDQRNEFVKAAQFDLDAPYHPHGHAMIHQAGDRQYVYFGNPHPFLRAPAKAAALENLSEYEAFTCLTPGSPLKSPGKDGIDVTAATVERDVQGRPRWGWKKDAPPIAPAEQRRLMFAGKLRAGETLHPLRDLDSDRTVQAHAGNVAWNAYRRAWVMIVGESAGEPSNLGETWYAEAPTPIGPWLYARKIVTHDKVSFYNPAQHPALQQDNGRLVYFEGTHTIMFSDQKVPTPRYEYNQIMYRIDLADPRLSLPAPAFQQSINGADRLAMGPAAAASNTGVAFFAMQTLADGLTPIFATHNAKGETVLSLDKPADATGDAGQPLFYGLPADTKKPPHWTAPLYAWSAPDGKRTVYSAADKMPAPLTRGKKPICLVWRSPLVNMPIAWE